MGTPFKLMTATKIERAEPINPNRETVVDLQIAAYETILDGEALTAVPAFGLVVPGEQVGDELVIRVLPRNNSSDNNVPLTLIGQPETRVPYPPAWVPLFEGFVTSAPQAALYFFPTDAGTGELFGPSLIILRWTGRRWLIDSASAGWSAMTPS